MISPFNPISKWWQKNHFQKFGTIVSVLLSSKQNYHIYWTYANILEGEMKSRQKWLHPLLATKLLCSIPWIYPNFPICYDISKPPKFYMDYNFHSRIVLADAHSKYILIILVIHSQNFRKLTELFSELEQDENRTQKRKSNKRRKTVKKVEYWQGDLLEATEFNIMGWG